MTIDITPNDVAFIKVSKELHQVRHSLVILEAFKSYTGRGDQWSKQKLQDADRDKVLLPELQCFGDILPYLVDDGEKLRSKISNLQNRTKQLEKLTDTYMKGGDIVAAKLAS